MPTGRSCSRMAWLSSAISVSTAWQISPRAITARKDIEYRTFNIQHSISKWGYFCLNNPKRASSWSAGWRRRIFTGCINLHCLVHDLNRQAPGPRDSIVPLWVSQSSAMPNLRCPSYIILTTGRRFFALDYNLRPKGRGKWCHSVLLAYPVHSGGHNAALYYSLDVHFSKAGSDKRFTHHIYSATFI